MGNEKPEKLVRDLQQGEQFFYESAVLEMGWNRFCTVIKSFNPEFKVGKTIRINEGAKVELLTK